MDPYGSWREPPLYLWPSLGWEGLGERDNRAKVNELGMSGVHTTQETQAKGGKGISLIQFRVEHGNCDVDMNMERAGPSRTPPIWLKPRAVVQTTELDLTSPPKQG